MPVILEKKLMGRLVRKGAFLANDVCIGAFAAYKLSSSRTKVQMYSGYRGLISGLDTMPCAVGDAFSFTKASTFGDGPFPGFLGRVLSVDEDGDSFDIGFDMGSATLWESVTGGFFFCSPVEMGLLGMFEHCTLDFYVGDVPAASDDLDSLESACKLVPSSVYPGEFDHLDYSTYARMSYDAEGGVLTLSGMCAGVATQSGPVTWVRVSTYCRERTSLEDAEIVRYSLIVPVAENPGVYIDGDLVEDQPASIGVLSISI